jgi:hypothetical protein
LKTRNCFSVFGLSWDTAKLHRGGFLNNDALSMSTQQPTLPMVSVPKRSELGREKFWESKASTKHILSANRKVSKWAGWEGSGWRLANSDW